MSDPILISEDNVSIAWAKAVREVKANKTSPLCVSIVGFENDEAKEDLDIRSSLNALLKRRGIVSVRETSETIFPYHHWDMKRPTAAELTTWYLEKYLPRHRARARMASSRITTETYFERLVGYHGYEAKDKKFEPKLIDQLERIIDTFWHYKRKTKTPRLQNSSRHVSTRAQTIRTRAPTSHSPACNKLAFPSQGEKSKSQAIIQSSTL